MDKHIRNTTEEILEEFTNCYSEADEDCLAEMLRGLVCKVAKDIFSWFDDNAVNLNFFTGNFEINLGMYLELKKKYESEGGE